MEGLELCSGTPYISPSESMYYHELRSSNSKSAAAIKVIIYFQGMAKLPL
jgi:hypothetical protein